MQLQNSSLSLPEVPFGTNIRTNSEVHIETCLLHQLYEPHQIIVSPKVILQYPKEKKKCDYNNKCIFPNTASKHCSFLGSYFAR